MCGISGISDMDNTYHIYIGTSGYRVGLHPVNQPSDLNKKPALAALFLLQQACPNLIAHFALDG